LLRGTNASWIGVKNLLSPMVGQAPVLAQGTARTNHVRVQAREVV
jgi:hypothetical protein